MTATTTDQPMAALTLERWVHHVRQSTHSLLNDQVLEEQTREWLPPLELEFLQWIHTDTEMSRLWILRLAAEEPGWLRSVRRHYLRALPCQKPAFPRLEDWIEAEHQLWSSHKRDPSEWLKICERIDPGCFNTAALPRYLPAREIELLEYCCESDKCTTPEMVHKFFQRPRLIRTYRAIEEIAYVSGSRSS